MFTQRKPESRSAFRKLLSHIYFVDSFRFYNKRVAADTDASIHTGMHNIICDDDDDYTTRKSRIIIIFINIYYYCYGHTIIYTYTMLNM